MPNISMLQALEWTFLCSFKFFLVQFQWIIHRRKIFSNLSKGNDKSNNIFNIRGYTLNIIFIRMILILKFYLAVWPSPSMLDMNLSAVFTVDFRNLSISSWTHIKCFGSRIGYKSTSVLSDKWSNAIHTPWNSAKALTAT